MPTGFVKWFDPEKKFGFITSNENKEELFVHASNVEKLEGHLEEGEKVEFQVGQGRKGKEAIKVKPL